MTKFSKNDLTPNQKMVEIHNNYLNGNLCDMVELIKEYGLYDFWFDYECYLFEHFNAIDQYKDFTKTVISYFHITER